MKRNTGCRFFSCNSAGQGVELYVYVRFWIFAELKVKACFLQCVYFGFSLHASHNPFRIYSPITFTEAQNWVTFLGFFAWL